MPYPCYRTIETDDVLSGNVDVYYGYNKHHELRGHWLKTECEKSLEQSEALFKRCQYRIEKDKDGNPINIRLFNESGPLDILKEIKKELDHLTFAHRWIGDPYRFNHKIIRPIGAVQWLAPDLFFWDKEVHFNDGKYIDTNR